MTRRLGLWFVGFVVVTPIVTAIIVPLVALSGESPTPINPLTALPFGLAFTSITAVPALLVIATWPALSRRFANLEGSVRAVAIGLAPLPMLLALAVVVLERVPLSAFVLSASLWAGLVVPRLVLGRLRPGAFVSK
jgi:hypothetical protein